MTILAVRNSVPAERTVPAMAAVINNFRGTEHVGLQWRNFIAGRLDITDVLMAVLTASIIGKWVIKT